MPNNSANQALKTDETLNPSDLSDAELIRQYQKDKSNAAFEALLRRHYNAVHKRLMRLTQNHADADDLSQKLWIRVLENLANYNDAQKFPNFLNTIASNLLKDEWRKSGVRQQSSLDEMLETGNGQALLLDDDDVTEQIANRHEIEYLVKQLIPNLATKLRAVFLLRHESEYWDDKQPFQWQHLAELNQITADEAGKNFMDTRDALLNASNQLPQLDDESRLIFITWTQAHRHDKAAKQTETYLASLLDIPLNTFKTRYRTALAELSTGLEKWRAQVVKST